MAAQEDQALLALIFQHLRVNGFTTAARVLEKHLPQVEAPPAESLHDIYSGWMKMCSVAQPPQRSVDSLNSKSVEELISSEVEAADSEPCVVSGGDEMKGKLLTESQSDIESSHPEENPESPPEPQQDAAASVPVLQGQSASVVEDEETKEQPTNIQQEGSLEEEEVSPDTLEAVELQQPGSDLTLEAEATEEPQDVAEASKELVTHSNTSEVPSQAPPSEWTDSAQDVLDGEEEEKRSSLEPSELISVDPMEEETHDPPIERQAPPPADFVMEKPKDAEEEQMEKEENNHSESVGGAALSSELNPDAAADESTHTPAEAVGLHSPHSDEPEEVEASIIFNIQTDVEAALQEGSGLEESSESCADAKTPKKKKKKKKSKRNRGTPEIEAQVTDTDPVDAPLTSKSSKKKRRRHKRGEDDVKEEAEEEEVPAAAPEKKRAKKRKRDQDAFLETRTTEMQIKDLEAENTPAETAEKPKKKKRKKEKAPSAEAPAEGDVETEENIDIIHDGSSALLLSGQKKQRLCRKLNLRIRPRFLRKRMSSIQSRQKTGKKKPKEETLDENSRMNPVKRTQADDEMENKPPKRKRKKMKIITELEETFLKEIKPPRKEKKSMETERDKNGAGEELLEDDLSLLSNEGKKKKRKSKKKRVKDENLEECSGSADVSQPPLSKKKKKSRLEARPEDGDSHTPAVSVKKKKSSN